VLRKALLLLSGNAAGALFTLARNLILARLIPVEDYGIAATFAVTMAVVEMASALGLQQQIVQAREGNEPRFQATLQSFQLIRGAAAGAILFLLAPLLADFLSIPQVAWAYQVLAVMPVLNALIHFDVYRLQRHAVYRNTILTATIPAGLSLLSIWPLVILFGDWRAMLASIILQGLAAVVVAHVLAERRYELAFDTTIIRRSLRFGLPILGDAVLLFFVFNGEKLIIGRELGMGALGIYAMGVTLTLTPTLVAGRTVQNLFVPRLAQARERMAAGDVAAADRHQTLASAACEITMLFALMLVVGVMLLGAPFVEFVLGAKYAPLIPILALLSVQQGLRVLKDGPSAVALAAGQTENALAANILRILLLPVAWWVAFASGRLDVIIAIAIVGEAAGFGIALWLMRRRTAVRLRPVALQVALTFAVLGAIASLPDPGPVAQAAIMLGAACAALSMRFTQQLTLRR
jgi:O-antigen/teichoic acid export membrane protein